MPLGSGGLAGTGDDLVAIGSEGMALLPLPTSLSIKAGSWPILESLYPVLPDLATLHLGRYLDLHPRDAEVMELQAELFDRLFREVGVVGEVETLAAIRLNERLQPLVSGERRKETDRIAALATELRKFGATVEERADGLTITPGALRGAAVDTYNDHRMAMAFALTALRVPGAQIADPGCTSKTFPAYFDTLTDALNQTAA